MKKVISFLAGDGGNYHFVKPVITYLQEYFDVRVYDGHSFQADELQRILNESDLVWYEWGNGPVVQASRLKKKAKTICRIHRYEILGNEIKAVNWNNIDNIIFVNEEFHLLFKELVNKDIDAISNVNVIPNPVATVDKFIEKKPGYNIAYVSRFNPDKNPSLMVQVLKKLTDADPGYKIYMAGGVQDLQLYLYCKHIIKELGLEKNFIYEGIISDIPGWLADKQYFLSTSIVEAHPVSVTEAMMQGIKPVLHNSFGRLGNIFDKKFLYNTPEEAVNCIREKQYNSIEYRNYAIEKFSLQAVLPKIKLVIDAAIQNDSFAAVRDEEKNAPLITVAIVTYNRAKYISEAIDSVLIQEGNFEILVVDDGSSDNTRDIVEGYNSDKIRYFKNSENLGRPGARNRCVAEAKGDYILWLGDDDTLVPGMLREYTNIINRDRSVDIVYGNIQAYDQETGEDIALFSANDYTASNEKLLMNIILGSGLTDGGSLIKKSLYESFGGYDSEYLRAQDNELWTRLGPNAKFYKVNRTIYRYRKHNNNVSFGSFVDTTYESKTIRRILNRYPLNKIFGNTSVEDALLFAAQGLFNFGDYYNSAKLLRKSGIHSSSRHFELYIHSLINMGLPDEASGELNNKNNGVLADEKKLAEIKTKICSLYSFRESLIKAHRNKEFGTIRDIIQNYLLSTGNIFDTVYALGKMLAEVNENKMASDYLKLALKFNPEHNDCFKLLMSIAPDAKSRDDIQKMKNRILEEIPLFGEEKDVKHYQDQPLVSVIITTFNRKQKLANAVKSVLNQYYKNYELIIVNDAGEDVSGITNSLKDNRIKLVNHTENKGLPAARNTGIKHSAGEYIAFLDDDDIYYPEHIETAIAYLKDYDVVYTDAIRCSIAKINGIETEKERSVPYSIDYNRNKLLIANIAPVNCFVFKKELLSHTGLFNEELKALEDWDFWLRLSEVTEFKHIKANTVQVNWFDDGSTMTSSRSNDFDNARKYIYTRYAKEIEKIPNKEDIVAEFNAIWKNDFKSEPVVSIIALTYNQVDYTKAFIESVLHNTSIPYELILVDNNSSDSTPSYLEELAASNKNVKIFLNKVNYGFPKGVNQGIKAATGKYILIANNDILVTENWLNRLVEAAENNPGAGLVGPISNSVSGVQLDKDAKYSTIAEMFTYARTISVRNKGKMFEFPRIAFLCTLIKKEVIEKIGGLDERFTPGNFEDDDFCLRAQLVGYKTLILQDVFIHHFGSKSFTAQGNQKYIDRLETNKQKFIAKWGGDPEDIWLKGKAINKRNPVYPVNKNNFIESFERAVIQIEEKEYNAAEESLLAALKIINEKGNYPVTKEDIQNLLNNLQMLQSEL